MLDKDSPQYRIYFSESRKTDGERLLFGYYDYLNIRKRYRRVGNSQDKEGIQYDYRKSQKAEVRKESLYQNVAYKDYKNMYEGS